MIGSLRGTVLQLLSGEILLDVQGVGYRVNVPMMLLDSVKKGDECFVYTHLQVKEDALDLFGFSTYEDLLLFEKLLTVSGIGPKTALGVFLVGKRDEIVQAIEKADVPFFTRVPRLGSKNAQKLIVELKGQLDFSQVASSADREVIDALIGFGFSEREAREALGKVDKNLTDISARIKNALKALNK